jgi:hypothetical protein
VWWNLEIGHLILRNKIEKMMILQSRIDSEVIFRCICIALALFGLYVSFKVVTIYFPLDSDISYAAILWDSVQANGISDLANWLYTQDNWLLSLMPIQFVSFAIFGVNAYSIVLVGWVIFVIAAIISGLIAWNLGARRAAFVIVPIFLLSNLYVHQFGYASHPISHNITNLFGLISILLIVKFLQKQTNTRLLLLFLFLVCGAVSDPWMLAAYNLPITLVSIIVVIFHQEIKISTGNCWKLFLLSVISIVAVKTKLFGAFLFLTPMSFSVGTYSIIHANAISLINILGRFFNILLLRGMRELLVQLALFNYLVKLHFPGVFNSFLFLLGSLLFQSISLVTIISLLGVNIHNIVTTSAEKKGARNKASIFHQPLLVHLQNILRYVFRKRIHILPVSIERQHLFIFSIFALMSVVITSFSFVLNAMTLDKFHAARFLLNCLYLVLLELAILTDCNWNTSSRQFKDVSALVFVLFLATSIISTDGAWLGPRFSSINYTQAEINFLSDHHLTYGYGPYWGSSAHVVTVTSKNKIKIRPVNFNKFTGQMMVGTRAQAHIFSKWYYDDIPRNQKTFFIFLRADGEECHNLRLCERGVIKQFGQPIKILRYAGARIYVWDHKLLPP